ncbi:MAG: chorismate synthase, partial [Oscillospiraceae bacterium]
SIFGESHGTAIGVVIDGIPAGTALDLDMINIQMSRRAPGQNNMSTPRKESDKVEIVSGLYNGFTTGTPLTGIIYNTNTKSADYNKDLIRPGHADFTGFSKYGKTHDFRGGGHFSGRLTAPLVFAGSIAMQILNNSGITIAAHISRIGKISDTPFDKVNLTPDLLNALKEKPFSTIDDVAGQNMKEEILAIRKEKNSIGGIIECGVVGVPIGLGEPFFGSVESRISSMIFSVPAVKGIEFGAGFGFADLTGKEANDEFYICEENQKTIKTFTNNNAGINGGITNGMPIVFKTVIKPTPSISQSQNTVNIKESQNSKIEINGRHDPCIVHRAIVVIEAVTALTILDLIKENSQI